MLLVYVRTHVRTYMGIVPTFKAPGLYFMCVYVRTYRNIHTHTVRTYVLYVGKYVLAICCTVVVHIAILTICSRCDSIRMYVVVCVCVCVCVCLCI